MRLRQQILSGYAVPALLLVGVVAWAVLHLVSLGRASGAILRENYRSILAAEWMLSSLERQDSAVLLSLGGRPDEGRATFHENEGVFLLWLGRAKDNVTLPGEGDLLGAIERRYGSYRDLSADAVGPAAPATAEPLARYAAEIQPAFLAVRERCIELRHLNQSAMYDASERADLVARTAIWSTLGVALAALAVAAVLGWAISGRVTRPLAALTQASRRVGAGDYAVRVSTAGRDEVTALAHEFNRMAEQLERYHALNIEKVLAEQEKGEAVLQSIEDGLVVLAPDLGVLDANRAARHLLGLPPGEPLPRTCADLLPGAPLVDLVKGALAPRTTPADERERVVPVARGGDRRHLLVSATPIRGHAGDRRGIVLLLKDVTRLKELERLKSEFVMAASHELRTPLASIGMSIDLLREHVAASLAPRDQGLLAAAHEEVQRLVALVSDLLDLSRIESGRIALEFEPVDVTDLVDRVRSLFRTQAEQRGVEVSCRIEAGLPRVRADAAKATWVLTNLVSNALRYVPEKGHIEIGIRRIGAFVHVGVRDDGPGIPPEYQSRIFQRFVQVRGRESGGTGLGLTIAREIVRAHGGTIWVESKEGHGSLFTFTLPVADEEDRHGASHASDRG